MDVQIEPSWKQHLAPEFEKPYFVKLTNFVRQQYRPRPETFGNGGCRLDFVRPASARQGRHRPVEVVGRARSVHSTHHDDELC